MLQYLLSAGDHIDFDDLLALSFMRSVLLQRLRYFVDVRISLLPELGYPVVKSAWSDSMLFKPLMVGKAAVAAFHDKLILFVCCASLRFHTGNLHSYSKTLAFIVSSADTVVKCWHLSSIIMANFVMILNPP